MTRIRSILYALALLSIGYLCGASGQFVGQATAQNGDALPDQVSTRIRDAYRRLQDAKDSLESNGQYEAITEGINTFLVLTGGGNAREDLESGRGVDPETFAGLYAGKALPEIQTLLGVNDKGQITYNNEVVRMYSKEQLRKRFAQRAQITELGL